MRGTNKYSKDHPIIFIIFLLCAILLFGCTGVPQDPPIIISFIAEPAAITEGENSTLSWTVTNANVVAINQGIGDVDPSSGSYDVTPTETTVYTLTAFNNAGSSSTDVTITVTPPLVEQTITIQPGPNEGKDSFADSYSSDTNNGNREYICIGNFPGPLMARGYLQLDLSSLPADAVILSADLKLYQYFTFGTQDFIIGIHRITDNWDENTITWNNQPDYHPMSESTSFITVAEITWLSWDITSLLQGWLDGNITNYGVVLKDSDEALGDTYIMCYSSDYPDDPTLRPKVEITYLTPIT